ncbi:hypothetical protein N5923_06565 [Erwiniaceae bacterium BAC15a-03b]|uniref:Uncharacterized protein n=1 Tax=Winslowiella arboricola TaxID=2978220 RepID=A0A9J6PIH1_9GAMM|nr:hypothetical protein [Winslowiella arboricola]MCU5772850.1 hypothetical protein [Winslowiella arboricola]MCU5777154.1 hypothetical protein [Winslowiella arboricola]
MQSTSRFLAQLQQQWRREPRPETGSGRFWLTPEQRIAIVRELLYPVAVKQLK